MDSLSTAFQSELMAILKCTELFLSKNVTIRRINITCNSSAATAALVKTTSESALVLDSTQALEKTSGSN